MCERGQESESCVSVGRSVRLIRVHAPILRPYPMSLFGLATAPAHRNRRRSRSLRLDSLRSAATLSPIQSSAAAVS